MPGLRANLAAKKPLQTAQKRNKGFQFITRKGLAIQLMALLGEDVFQLLRTGIVKIRTALPNASQ